MEGNMSLGNPAGTTEFQVGQMVQLRSNPSVRGPVTAVTRRTQEDLYTVFADGESKMLYASQLQLEAGKESDTQYLPLGHFHSYMTALQLRHPSLSNLYSLNSARIDFVPYQFRPVFKFIRSERPRLLIADGVGVGKTIEAGLIVQELQARRDIQSVLIICPRPLVVERKWQVEMKRFGEQFIHLDSSALRYCLNEMDLEGIWPEQYKKSIVPYSLFDDVLLFGTPSGSNRRKTKSLLALDPPPRFDLVIVDEAHHIRNAETYAHRAVRYFCDNAEAVLFLTATPIQLGSDDLFVLLNALRPDLVIDKKSFEHMAEPNPFINRAISAARSRHDGWEAEARLALEEAAGTGWGRSILEHNPEFRLMLSRLSEGTVPPEERVAIITDLEDLHTFSRLISRTRRRDIGEFTVRKPYTITVEFTPDQKALHDGLLETQAKILRQLHDETSVKFMMTTLRRQAGSCIYGLAPFINDILNRHLDELLLDEDDDGEELPDKGSLNHIGPEIKKLVEQAKHLGIFDPKLEALKKIIRDKLTLPNNKIMLFSSFRHTLAYIYEHLKGDGFRVGLVHGDTPDEERQTMRNRFQLVGQDPQIIDVLLFSEIGCEGLDYQFCDCIVNYDLPWNPMRIEQRIGRIDRNGQKSETIAIFNLITPGTIDADIYERCLTRLGVFKNSIGDNEEILGEITRGIRAIAENFTLSESERQSKLQQLADNQIRLFQEQQELEDKQAELFGIRLPPDRFSEEVAEASSYWLLPISIQRLVEGYLCKISADGKEPKLDDKALKTLRVSQDVRTRLFQDFRGLPQQSSNPYREWENWLKGSTPYLLVTFGADCASEHPEAAFITPIHPLVRQAAQAFDTHVHVTTSLKVKSDLVPSRRYHFAIFQWQFCGIRDDVVMCLVSQPDVPSRDLTNLLARAEDVENVFSDAADTQIQEALEAHHYDLWSDACGKHKKRTQDLARHRRESLMTSHHARISLLKEYLEAATDEKIQRMRRSQIAAAESDYARHLSEVDLAAERADIIAYRVAFGIIEVERGGGHAQ